MAYASPLHTPPERQFAKYYMAFDVGVAGSSFEYETDWDFAGQWVCDWIEVDFPPGCAHRVTLQVFLTDVQIIPWAPDEFSSGFPLSGDGQTFHFDLRVMVTQPLRLLFNNFDYFTHHFYFRAQLEPVRPDMPLAGVAHAAPVLVL